MNLVKKVLEFMNDDDETRTYTYYVKDESIFGHMAFVILTIIVALLQCAGIFVLFFTSPVWLAPYLIGRMIIEKSKQENEEENEDVTTDMES